MIRLESELKDMNSSLQVSAESDAESAQRESVLKTVLDAVNAKAFATAAETQRLTYLLRDLESQLVVGLVRKCSKYPSSHFKPLNLESNSII